MPSLRKDSRISASTAFEELPGSAHIRLPAVAELYGASPTTIWRWAKLGLIPAPKKLGPGLTAWNVGQLRDDLKAKGQ